MSYLLYSCIDMDVENTNKAFEDVISWMEDINMTEEAEKFADEFGEVLERNNPFSPRLHDKFYSSPQDKMIALIYETAEKVIKEKYPNAVITTKVNGYNSTFKIDDETYKIGNEAKMEDDE